MALTATSRAFLDHVAAVGIEVLNERAVSAVIDIIACNVETRSEAYFIGYSLGVGGFSPDLNPWCVGQYCQDFDLGHIDGEVSVNELLDSIEAETDARAYHNVKNAARNLMGATAALCITVAAAIALAWPAKAEDRLSPVAFDVAGQSGYSLQSRMTITGLVSSIFEGPCIVTSMTACADAAVPDEGNGSKVFDLTDTQFASAKH